MALLHLMQLRPSRELLLHLRARQQHQCQWHVFEQTVFEQTVGLLLAGMAVLDDVASLEVCLQGWPYQSTLPLVHQMILLLPLQIR